MLMRGIAAIVVLIGVGFLLYPTIENHYTSNQQSQMLEALEKTQPEIDTNEMIESYQNVNQILEAGERESSQQKQSQQVSEDPLIGSIEIPTIDLKLPLLEGAGMDNLEYAVGHMSETAQVGEIGNAALAGHRGYSYGRLFNRLDEVKEGQDVKVANKNETFTYRVTETLLVLPTDLSVLEQPTDKSMVTLITCHPIKDPTHRLIVQAELVEEGS
ncbi:class D sortase [Halobacillus sp. MO56]